MLFCFHHDTAILEEALLPLQSRKDSLQEDREIAEHTTCTPPGTLNLSNQLKTFLDMSHSPLLVIHESPYEIPSDLGSHAQSYSRGIFQITRYTKLQPQAQGAHLIFACLLFLAAVMVSLIFIFWC